MTKNTCSKTLSGLTVVAFQSESADGFEIFIWDPIKLLYFPRLPHVSESHSAFQLSPLASALKPKQCQRHKYSDFICPLTTISEL